ncbi:MAG: tRNA (adenosine(37)-N6)-threonylcarbamoyltransferase complex dimerization subunit type 1 TsaB, partial [Treponema sp.]|nr:tRNA (adenosine(37)-N6)-threonylcarbamoyltransferase complex dimerization subunit type 1 TsaB [Treponema sp.]
MNLLAIDSAASVLSVAAAAGENICCFQTEAGVKHSEIVMDCIDAQMKKAGLEPQSLNGILCMGGPGSFTGLRIGFSVAKGLALALGIPFAYFPTLDCMAMPHSGFSGLVIPVIAASKNAFFCAPYRGCIRCGPDTKTNAGQIAAVIAGHKNSKTEKTLLSGSGVEASYAILP